MTLEAFATDYLRRHIERGCRLDALHRRILDQEREIERLKQQQRASTTESDLPEEIY